jgi:hopanoid biosynthesis associated RND transporter like protein HpnN
LKDWIDHSLGPRLGSWVEAAARRSGTVASLAVVLTLCALALTATRLGINSETEAMLSEDLFFRQAEFVFEDAFPHFDEDILLVVDAPTPEGARLAQQALAEGLRAEPERFSNVFAPGSGPFFEAYGLLYLEVDQLERLGNDLARAQPFLAELAADPSLRGLFSLLERSLGAELDVDGVDRRRVLDRVTRSVEAAVAGRDEPFFFESLLLGEVLAQDSSRRLVIAKPVIDFTEFLPAQAALERMREIVRELRIQETFGARVRITGDLALETEDFTAANDHAMLAGAASFLLVSGILFLALGALRPILATVATLLVGLALTAGFATLAIGHLNLVSITFAVLFIGLAVDFGIHLCLRYQDFLAQGTSHAEALNGAGRTVGGSLALCAVTTAIGFYVFVPTDYSGVAELGLIAGTGMFISLGCTLTLLPALLSLGLAPGVSPPVRPRPTLQLPRFPQRHPRSVRLLAAVLALGALASVPWLRFDANPLAVRDPGTESTKMLRELLEDTETSPWGVEVLAEDPARAQDLAGQLAELQTVSATRTLHDFVPAHQDVKREILTEISFFMGLPPEGSERAAPSREELLATISSLRERADQVGRNEGMELAASARRLTLALDALVADPEASKGYLERLDRALLPPVKSSIRRLSRALSPGPVEEADIPLELRRRFETEDGRRRVQVLPVADLYDSDALEVFVDDVARITPASVGGAVRIVESKRHMSAALRQALVGAVVAIAAVLWLLWRRVRDTALVLAPLLLAALFTCAVSVLAGLPLNYANVIVLPLLLGIGVDSGIHLVHRWRSGEKDLLGTSTARGVFWSALTTVASFGSLGFASHLGMASLGQLLTLGVALTLVCNLFVLPALLPRRTAR